MTERARKPEARVGALWRRVAVHLGVAAAGGILAAVAALLLTSWLAGNSSAWVRPSALPLMLWAAALAGLGFWVWRLSRRALDWDRPTAASEIERRVGLRRGSVRGAVELDRAGHGTSRALADLHRQRIGDQLAGRRVAELGSFRASGARVRAISAAALAVVTLLASASVWLLARDSASRAWAEVLHPVRHLSSPPLPPLRIAATEDRIRRGRDLPVIVSAPQRDSVLLAWQPRGQVANRRWHAVMGGRAAAVVPHLDSPTRVWATAADGASSDTLHITPFDPLLLLDVRVDLRFPLHTGREREVMSTPLPAMSVPQGTWATVTATTTRPVESATLRSAAGASISFEVTDERRFRRGFTVRPGSWGWSITGVGGQALEGEPDSLYFQTVPDSVPAVNVVYPGVDTLLSTTMTQPLVIDVRDDYGLSRVEVVSWRVSVWGERWPDQIDPVEIAGDAPRASLPTLLDARGRGFLPGDTLRYFVRAFDNAPEPQEGRSREFVLRLPTLDEVRERAIAETRDLVEGTEDLAERARRQEEALQALERATRTQPPPGRQLQARDPSGVEFRETEAARQALEEAAQLLDQSQQIQEQLRQVQEAVQASGLNDTTVLERLREIEALYERILTPQLREQIEQLREALSDLDEQRIREAIQELAEGSADYRERVEQTLELLKRAALEQEFGTLETQAEELAEQHEQFSQQVSDLEPGADSARAGLERQAEDLSGRAEQLSERTEDLADELSEAGERDASDKAAEAQRSSSGASRSDQQVANSLQSQQRQAGQSAQRAASQMQQAANSLREGREQMQQSWRREVTEALERTQTEALELARRQDQLTEQMRSSDANERAEARSEQAALKRGADQMQQELAQATNKSLLLDRSIMEGMGNISEMMSEMLSQMSDGTRQSRGDPQLSGQITESLNDLAYQAMKAGDSAGSAQSGTGLQEALQQLAQLAEQQGDLNAQAGGISPGDAAQAILQQLQQLAGRQRAISEELQNLSQELGPRGQVLGRIDELGREAEDLADELQRGRIDQEIIERQNQLFNRLLDAGRTLEQDEFERERRAERPGSVEIVRPGELSPDLLEGPLYPLPDAETLNRYPPALRRLILEYFDRLNRGDGSGGQ
jgi:hypothetical protein